MFFPNKCSILLGEDEFVVPGQSVTQVSVFYLCMLSDVVALMQYLPALPSPVMNHFCNK